MTNIYQSISAIMADCPAISKGQKNAQQGFMYRGVDVVMNVLQPLMIKHKVFAVPRVLEASREERQTKSGGNLIYTVLKVEYTFYAEDGSSVSAIVQGEGMDSADKSSNKAMSVAFKYACFQVFCIPTEEMIDPDATTPEPSTKKTPAKAAVKNEPKKRPEGITCCDCGKTIQGISFTDSQGVQKEMPVEMIVARSQKAFGVALCAECGSKRKAAENGN